MDGLHGETDVSRAWKDTLNMSNQSVIPTIVPGTISTHPTEAKQPDPLTMGANGCANETDRSRNHPRTLNMCMQMITPANEAGNISMHPNEPEWPNLPAGSATSCSDDPNSIGDHADALSACTDGHSVTNDMNTATNATKIIRASPNEPKMQNSPSEAARQHSDEPNTCGNLTNGSSARMGSHSIETNARMPANKAECVRMCQIDPKSQNSPYTLGIEPHKHPYRWKQVSAGSVNIYVPLNVQITPPSRNFVFGRVEGGDEVMAAREVGERAGNGGEVGNHDERNGDGDNMTSGSSVDLK